MSDRQIGMSEILGRSALVCLSLGVADQAEPAAYQELPAALDDKGCLAKSLCTETRQGL